MMDLSFTSNQGWYLTLLSSSLCVLGCFVIYLDDIYTYVFPRTFTKKYKFQLKENYVFLNGALAFSSGCLLFTALFGLLPESLEYFKNFNKQAISDSDISEKKLNFYLIISFISGVLLCFLFNAVLHLITSQSVVHCNHNGEEHLHGHSHDNDLEQANGGVGSVGSSGSNNDTHTHTHVQTTTYDNEADTETTSLLDEQKPLDKRRSLIHYFTTHNGDENKIGECKGYSSAELCLFNKNHATELHFCEIPSLAKSSDHDLNDRNTHGVHPILPHFVAVPNHFQKNDGGFAHGYDNHTSLQGEDHNTHRPDHHHHINTPLSRLLLIGIQTTLAISLHKLPEGFITFITSEANPDLGFLIFLSLAAHNFTEGFLMCLPLYFLFSSSDKGFAKLKAVTISSVLGGLSQPLGAIIGFFFLKYNNTGESFNIHSLSFVLGVALAVTSGFLSVIGLSMYGSAISFNGGMLNILLFWCILGMCIIGLSSIVSV